MCTCVCSGQTAEVDVQLNVLCLIHHGSTFVCSGQTAEVDVQLNDSCLIHHGSTFVHVYVAVRQQRLMSN